MTTATISASQSVRSRFADYIYQYGVYILLVLLIVFFTSRNGRFLSVNNALTILQQAAPLGIAAIGMTFVLMTAGIDISVGQNMYLSAILVAIAMEAMKPSGFLGSFGSYVIIFAIAILTGGLIGALNGLMIARFKIVPFITTLATMGIARGIGLIASNSRVYYVEKLGPISNGRLGVIPYVVIILIVLVIVFDYVLRRTSYGRQLMAIGNDSTAAQKIGINVQRQCVLGVPDLRGAGGPCWRPLRRAGGERGGLFRRRQRVSGHFGGGAGRYQPVRGQGQRFPRRADRHHLGYDDCQRHDDDERLALCLQDCARRDHFLRGHGRQRQL